MKFYTTDQHKPGDVETWRTFAWVPKKVETETGPAWVWLEQFERQMRYIGHGKWWEMSRNHYVEYGCGL